MSKRVRFDEKTITAKVSRYESQPEQPSTSKENFDISKPGSRFKENHSLDSDDEDEETKAGKEDFEKLTEEDVEGAENEDEDDPYQDDDGPQITPFNLKEEMAEGSFDKMGHYHFKKDMEIRDNWLDNIDWVKVKKSKNPTDVEMDGSDEEEQNELFDEAKILQEIVEILRKGETVSGGLRRLGGGTSNKKKSRAWKREKMYDLEAKDEAETNGNTKGSEDNNRMFLELTELADRMAGAGHYDIYTDSFEKLQHKLNTLKVAESSKAPDIPEGASADDALDMFADDIDTSAKEGTSEPAKTGEDVKDADADDSVKWEYKWSEDATETFGPFTSLQMAEWKDEGFFSDKVKVRKVGSGNAPYYNVKRIDFDLYD